jgi:HD superfamily phosphodiesterase
MESTFEIIKKEIIVMMPKEYFCHLQFVHRMAVEFQRLKGGDLEIIELAAIAHDCGRVDEGDNSMHAEIGAEKIASRLAALNYDRDKLRRVARCVLMHNKESGFESIEEEIIMNADHISKVLYHEAFMLMVKKESFQDRAKWAIKYLDKGYNKATFQDIKAEYANIYQSKRKIYESVL